MESMSARVNLLSTATESRKYPACFMIRAQHYGCPVS